MSSAILTDFNQLVICVTAEKSEGEEGNDRVDWWHVKDSYAETFDMLSCETTQRIEEFTLTFVAVRAGRGNAFPDSQLD